MRFTLLSATLLSAALLASPARATTVDFSLSGLDAASKPYTFAFAIDPAIYTLDADQFLYSGVTLTGNAGATETVNIDLYGDTVSAFSSIYITSNGGPFTEYFTLSPNSMGTYFITGDNSTGLPPTVTNGTYNGVNGYDCVSSLPLPRSLNTLALFSIPVPVTNCGATVTLNVTTPSTTPTVTPEPSTLALLGTGALGVFGIARRRLFS